MMKPFCSTAGIQTPIKVPMMLAILGYWAVGLPTAYILGMVLGWRGTGRRDSPKHVMPEIACKNIQGGWDDSVKRYHSLELTRIRFVRTPSKEEVSQVVASLSWQVGDNLLEPVPETPKSPKAPDPEGLERVREVNLARAERMPNFIADEVAVRSLQDEERGGRRIDDFIGAQRLVAGCQYFQHLTPHRREPLGPVGTNRDCMRDDIRCAALVIMIGCGKNLGHRTVFTP